MSVFDDLLEVFEKLKQAEPVTVRIEVRDLATLRRYTGTAAPRTDALGIGNWAGVPVYETDDVPDEVVRCIKSDGSFVDIPAPRPPRPPRFVFPAQVPTSRSSAIDIIRGVW